VSWKDRAGLLDELEIGLGSRGALWFTTNPGLEDVVADEFSEQLAAADLDVGSIDIERKPLGFSGNVIALVSRFDVDIERIAGTLRSVHHVARPLFAFELADGSADALITIYEELANRRIPALEMDTARSFRITTRRSGDHDFSSMDVQRRAGAALIDRYHLNVNLEQPECEVRVDVIDNRCLVGIQLTQQSLSRRKQRQYNPRGAIKSNVAYSLLRFARLFGELPAGRILDPFCGSATIPIEAAQMLPELQIDASDYSERAVKGARLNVDSAGLSTRIDVMHRDMSDLPEHYDANTFDAIVTNPPFGVRIGRGMNFLAFYIRFLDIAAHLLKSCGLLIFLACCRGVVDQANRPRDHFRRNHARVVETGGIFPRIYVLEKRRKQE